MRRCIIKNNPGAFGKNEMYIYWILFDINIQFKVNTLISVKKSVKKPLIVE